MSTERCACGHAKSYHDGRFGCWSDRCMNLCVAYLAVVLPDPGERPVFGVHRLRPDEAWTPEPLSDYWTQAKRWKP